MGEGESANNWKKLIESVETAVSKYTDGSYDWYINRGTYPKTFVTGVLPGRVVADVVIAVSNLAHAGNLDWGHEWTPTEIENVEKWDAPTRTAFIVLVLVIGMGLGYGLSKVAGW